MEACGGCGGRDWGSCQVHPINALAARERNFPAAVSCPIGIPSLAPYLSEVVLWAGWLTNSSSAFVCWFARLPTLQAIPLPFPAPSPAPLAAVCISELDTLSAAAAAAAAQQKPAGAAAGAASGAASGATQSRKWNALPSAVASKVGSPAWHIAGWPRRRR